MSQNLCEFLTAFYDVIRGVNLRLKSAYPLPTPTIILVIKKLGVPPFSSSSGPEVLIS